MSQKSKLEYLKVLLNVKSGVYQNDKLQLKKDLLIIKKLLLLECNSNNQELIQLESAMQKVLKLA